MKETETRLEQKCIFTDNSRQKRTMEQEQKTFISTWWNLSAWAKNSFVE